MPDAATAWTPTPGDVLRKARMKRHLEQADVARLIGRSRQTISGWENGPTEPRVTEWFRLARALEAPWMLDITLFPKGDTLSVVGHNLRLPFKLPPTTVDVDLVAIEDEEAEHESTHRNARRVVRAS